MEGHTCARVIRSKLRLCTLNINNEAGWLAKVNGTNGVFQPNETDYSNDAQTTPNCCCIVTAS